jgi:hypothetical protein
MVIALLVLLAGPATKFGLLPWQAGLGIFALAALLAGIGGLLSVVALLRRRRGHCRLCRADGHGRRRPRGAADQ